MRSPETAPCAVAGDVRQVIGVVYQSMHTVYAESILSPRKVLRFDRSAHVKASALQ
jgi:hypothetical protein